MLSGTESDSQIEQPVMLVPDDGQDSEALTSAKRPLSDAEDAPVSQSKRPKDKEKSSSSEGVREDSTASSRRGYKKKKEVANTAGQKSMARPIDSASTLLLLFPDSSRGPGSSVLPELQSTICQSSRYKYEPITRCVACTRRGAGDTCRFRGIRYILRDAERHKFVGISFIEQVELTETFQMDFPSEWNRKLDREHIQRSKLSIAKALLPTLEMEQIHINSIREIIRRPRETNVRVTCDTCMTSLFSTSFMCRRCGREICKECFQIVEELTKPHVPEPNVIVDDVELTTRRKKLQENRARPNPSFLSCSKRNDPHIFSEFTPVTRFAQLELNRGVEEMQHILHNLERTEIRSQTPPQRGGLTYADTRYPSAPFPDPIASPIYDDFTPPNTPPHVSSIPVHRAQIIPASFYDSSSSNNNGPVFSSLWEKGLPLLVKDVMSRFRLTWNPEYFITRYGDQKCTIIECQSQSTRSVCVKEFFEEFGKYENRSECWKLKDWPPTADFKNTFPELFHDFSNAVPVPDYVRRDGVYNIASHFPSNALPPDLGPKMYNSMASSQEAGSQGSTRLHMDMADAFNVMLYASDCADGTPGYAVWDLFRAEDSDKIRDFLREKFTRAKTSTTNGQQHETHTQAEKAAAFSVQAIADYDPIHIQQFYLDVELRRQLWKEYGVKSFRIYQRPGEGVFIPAGCAHQVANIADCMKIAIDFVSPENIDRCEKLTKEFREQNQRKVWKEDVLQLRTMMWFAWQSCSKKELELREDGQGLDQVE